MAIQVPFHIVYATAPSTKLAKANCTDGGNPSGLSDWNDIAWVNANTTVALNLPSGISSSWSINFDSSNGGGGGGGYGTGFGDPDFPDGVTKSAWSTGQINTHIFTNFINLNPAKTYNILVWCFDNDGHPDGSGSITFNGTTLSGDAGQFPFKPLFSNITPDVTGSIYGDLTWPTTSTNVGGFIITEN